MQFSSVPADTEVLSTQMAKIMAKKDFISLRLVYYISDALFKSKKPDLFFR